MGERNVIYAIVREQAAGWGPWPELGCPCLTGDLTPPRCVLSFLIRVETISLWRGLEEPPLQHQVVQIFGDPYLCADTPRKLLLLLPVLW